MSSGPYRIPPPSPPPIPPRPDLSNLADSFSTLHVSPTQTPPALPPRVPEATAQYTPEFPITSEPLPPPLRTCPKFGIISFPTTCYQFRDTDAELSDFDICSHCYTHQISGHPHGTSFRPVARSKGMDTKCDFNNPRIARLWRTAVSNPNSGLEALKAYVRMRVKIPRCPDKELCGPEREVFKCSDPRIPTLAVCRACWEDRIAGTTFGGRFSTRTESHSPNPWTCDVAVTYLRRMLDRYAEENNWDAFVTSAKPMLTLPECPGVGAAQQSAVCYTTTREISEFAMCETCFYNYAAGTEWEHEIKRLSTTPGEWSCDMRALPLHCAWEEGCVEAKNFTLFWDAAHKYITSPKCSKDGVKDGTWYTLSGGAPLDFDICEPCYYGIIRPFIHIGGIRVENEFVKRHSEKGATRWCDFSLGLPKGKTYLMKFAEAVDRHDAGVLRSFVETFSTLLLCPNIKGVKGRGWWTPENAPEVTICDSCRYEIAVGTSLEKELTPRVPPQNQEHTCFLYSPRMCGLWTLACISSPPNLDIYLTPARERAQVLVALLPQWQMLRMQVEMRKTQVMYQQAMGNMNAIADVGMGIHYGPGPVYKYGSASGGWFNSPSGVLGEQYTTQASATLMGGMGERMELARVEALLKQVE